MRLIEGDCVESMRAMGEGSVDAVVCDPPYGLEFMGKEWDRLGATVETAQEGADVSHPFRDGSSRVRYGESAASMQAWHEAWAREALRVLRPGGHLLAFGGTRTYHRLACAVEDAGFEVRDCLCWHYGSGFPKSLDVSKAIDKAAGAEREVVGVNPNFRPNKEAHGKAIMRPMSEGEAEVRTIPATPAAERWQGWGTALKPAWEPIIVARKPLAGTVAANVLVHGTGALNVDGCRIGTDEGLGRFNHAKPEAHRVPDSHPEAKNLGRMQQRDALIDNSGGLGRWPANVVLSHAEGCAAFGGGVKDGLAYGDENGLETVEAWECVEGCPVAELDRQSGELKSGDWSGHRNEPKTRNAFGAFALQDETPRAGDSGGASRFFYTSKASSAERNAGLAGFDEHKPHDNAGHKHADERAWDIPGSHSTARANHHPTVKPIELMRWLVRLVTPPGGTVLDPFTGSGTTGCAAVLEGFEFIGCEREVEYVKIAEARIAWWAEHPEGVEVADGARAEVQRAKVADSGQSSIFDLVE